MSVPRSDYRTAVAIKNDERMMDVDVDFLLRDQDGGTATYVARCPRCKHGEIAVTVKLASDGGLAEDPACPALCTECEDRLDAMLEVAEGKGSTAKPNDRSTLNAFLKAMNLAWD
jgi:hypothetical protein